MAASAAAVVKDYAKAEKQEVRDLARSHTKAAINTLVRLMKAPRTPPGVKRQCAMDLISQGWGRPDSRADSGGVTAQSAGLTVNILNLTTGTAERIASLADNTPELIEAVDVERVIESGAADPL